MLIRRPDIKALFSKVESAGFKLQEARRDRFPKLSLVGNIGTNSNSIENIGLYSNLVTPMVSLNFYEVFGLEI